MDSTGDLLKTCLGGHALERKSMGVQRHFLKTGRRRHAGHAASPDEAPNKASEAQASSRRHVSSSDLAPPPGVRPPFQVTCRARTWGQTPWTHLALLDVFQ